LENFKTEKVGFTKNMLYKQL